MQTTVAYRVEAGQETMVLCEDRYPCPVGEEQSGRFDITITKAGYQTAHAQVTVQRDECHVITEQISVTLVPSL